MNKYFFKTLTLLAIIFIACNSKNEKESTFDIINVDISLSGNIEDFVRKIEIIPLETHNHCLLGQLKRIYFSRNYFILWDNNNVISLFDINGNFISNSAHCIGQGPNEYIIITACSFNEYSNCIEIVTPNDIFFYDLDFNLISKKSIPTQPRTTSEKWSLYWGYIFDLDKNKHIILPTTVSKDPYQLYIYDSENNKIIKRIDYSNDVISGLTMQNLNIRANNDSLLFFSPPAFDYYHYIMDVQSMQMKKHFKFDFGNRNLTRKDLNRFDTEEDKINYLLESKEILPLRTFFNEDYIISTLKMGNDFYTYYKNNAKNSTIVLKNRSDGRAISIPFFENLKDDILYTVMNPFEIDQYINHELTDRSIISTLKEDDNPVVIKYYLK